MTRKARATMHGAVSIVNAVPAGNGAAMGISLELVVEVELARGHGVKFLTGRRTDRLMTNIVSKVLPDEMESHEVRISIRSQIPIGFGLKSSSAVSNAVSLACARLKAEDYDDGQVVQTAVQSSLAAGVSITGAMDDASACYYGGIVLTDNRERRLIKRVDAAEDLVAVIFLPRGVARGDVTKLRALAPLFRKAFEMAEAGDYWNAMTLNGILAASVLSNPYAPILSALEAGALCAGISGNGPSSVAIVRNQELAAVQSSFSKFDGKIITSKVNNEKASVELIADG